MKTRFLYILVLLICAASFVFTSCAGNADNTILPGTTSSDYSASADSLAPNDAQSDEADGAGDEVAGSKEYAGWVGAYLDILTENKLEISSPNVDDDGVIAMLDVFGDETPELLYLYSYNEIWYDDILGDIEIPCLAIKILSYSEQGGIESDSDICINIAAGGPNNYCIYLTREGELMLYRSVLSGGSDGWGIWQIEPGRNLENTEEYWVGIYSSDLAKLYYARFPYENLEEGIVYKSDGKEISKEQYDKTAKEIIGDVDYMIFPGLGDVEMYDEEFWKGVTPFENKCMTYDEAIAWLKAQGDGQEQK